MQASNKELMTVVASRMLQDGTVVFVGVGLPNMAANLARQTRAPRLVLVYETGIVGAKPFRMPLSVGDAGVAANSQCILGSFETFNWVLQGGRIDVGFLGGAQIDRWGNLNSTVIGDYHRPTVRLPGSGGAGDIASMARRTIVVMTHERRRFPENVDFITSPGYVGGRRGRAEAGIRGGGPEMVITDLGILGFDEDGEMELRSVHPGVTVAQVQDCTGWKLKVCDAVRETQPPSEAELQALRSIDKEGFYR
ncbi:MAG: CoA-transferase [Pseudomonadota bacterium]